MKRILLFLCTAMLAGQAWAASTFSVGNLEYTVTGDNTVSVTGAYGYMEFAANIPEQVTYPEIDGVTYTVTSIADRAFNKNSTYLVDVTIPNSVTSIGEVAFEGCDRLSSVTIPESVTSIGDHAFYNCSNLTSVTFDEGSQLASIGNEAFSHCGLTSLAIPESVTSIGENAFSGVESVSYSGTAEGVPWGANEINGSGSGGSGSGTGTGTDDFFDVGNLRYIIIDEDNNYVSVGQGSNPQTRDLVINATVEYDDVTYTVISIGNYAFTYCSSLTSVVIPNSVTSIDDNAFVDCLYLKSVIIPQSVTTISRYAFRNCPIETLTINTNAINTFVSSLFNHLKSISIGNAVTHIDDDIFNKFGKITTVNIESDADFSNSGLYFTKDNIEYNVINQTTVEIAGSINYTGDLLIPSTVEAGNKFTVTSIAQGAFSGSGGLTSVTIPESITSIGAKAFENCNNVETLTYNTDAVSVDFFKASILSLTFPKLKNVIIGDAVTKIDDELFKGRLYLESVTIGNAVTSIGNNAFSGCGLTSITIPESVTRIGENAFSGCNKLTSITIETDADVSNLGLYFKKDGIRYKVLSKDYVEIVGNNKSSGNSYEYGGKPDEYSGKPDEHEGKPDEYSGKPDEYEGKPDDDKPENDDNLGNSSEDDDITNITELVIPATVTAGSTFTIVSIADNAFGNYNNLTSITIETDVDVSRAGLSLYKDGIYYRVLTKNTLSAFNHKCRDAVVIPATVDMFTVTTISFTKYSPTITSLTIPNTITKIDRGALGVFDNLESVTIESDCDLSDAGLSFKKDGISYEVLSKSTAKLVNGRNCSGDLVIPDTIDVGNDFAVTSIGVSAFLYCGNLTSITLPKSLERIGGSAFGFCENLNSITLPEKLTSIEDEAFANCINLSSITIPESVTNIGNRAFEMCSGIKSITYNSDYVGSLFRDLFFFAGHNIQTVNIGDAVTRIDDGAFGICPNLTSITIPEQITYVGENAFDNCENLTSVTIETNADVSNAGLSFTKDDIGYSVLSRNSAKLTNGASFLGDLVIPEKVIAGNTFAIMGIGEQAFANNTNLTSVTLPEWVTSIGDGAFSGCNNIETLTYNTDAVGALFSGIQSLKTVNIGDAVTRLEDGVFAGCKYLENVSVGNGIESVGNNVFSGCNFLDYNIYSNGYYLGNSQNPNMILMSARNKSITSCTVSADCRFICDGAFSDCKKLAEVVLPESLTYVNNGLFAGCSSLRSVAIPESVTAIGDEAFKGCSSLAEIKIPESVTTIGSSAFAGCSGIKALTIPNGVTSVSNNAFDGCTGLESVVIGKSVAEFSSGIFANCSGLNSIICYAETPIRLEDDPFIFNDTIYVPAASVSAYKSATIWKRKDIMPFYKVKILSANEVLGTAEGDTLILGDHTATLTATAAEGYHFVRWSDNNTDNPRAFAATKDTMLTAFFEAHTSVTDLAVAVTCEAYGLTEGSHCPGCGHVFVKQDTLPAQGHKVVVDAAVAATCTTAGKTEGSHCSVCNAVMKAQEVIAAPGHTVVVDLAKPATCTVTGWTDGKHCSVCNTILVAPKEVPAFGHEFGEYVYNNDATTESDGTETALCKHGCGASVSRVALGTKLAESTTQPETGTAVAESAASNVIIYAHHNTIVVENAKDEIRVYNAMGALVGRDVVCRVRTELQVNGAGVYIVKVGNVVKRVMVND